MGVRLFFHLPRLDPLRRWMDPRRLRNLTQRGWTILPITTSKLIPVGLGSRCCNNLRLFIIHRNLKRIVLLLGMQLALIPLCLVLLTLRKDTLELWHLLRTATSITTLLKLLATNLLEQLLINRPLLPPFILQQRVQLGIILRNL